MFPARWFVVLAVHLIALMVLGSQAAVAGKVTVDLGNAKGVIKVGAVGRWDEDGNARKVINTKAKIDAPEVDASAKDTGRGKWVFENLPAGRYDFLIMLENKVRIEGFNYPPAAEFDPFIAGDAKVESEENQQAVLDDIKNQRHYENKVQPLYLGGNDKVIRVLVLLIRDLPTSYEADMPGAATMRFEVWQYDWQYGGWAKNRRTRVFHRVILPRDQLREWTWLWDAKLGGIEVGKSPLTVKYELPDPSASKLQGLRP